MRVLLLFLGGPWGAQPWPRRACVSTREPRAWPSLKGRVCTRGPCCPFLLPARLAMLLDPAASHLTPCKRLGRARRRRGAPTTKDAAAAAAQQHEHASPGNDGAVIAAITFSSRCPRPRPREVPELSPRASDDDEALLSSGHDGERPQAVLALHLERSPRLTHAEELLLVGAAAPWRSCQPRACGGLAPRCFVAHVVSETESARPTLGPEAHSRPGSCKHAPQEPLGLLDRELLPKRGGFPSVGPARVSHSPGYVRAHHRLHRRRCITS